MRLWWTVLVAKGTKTMCLGWTILVAERTITAKLSTIFVGVASCTFFDALVTVLAARSHVL